jgi:hypothetical protein
MGFLITSEGGVFDYVKKWGFLLGQKVRFFITSESEVFEYVRKEVFDYVRKWGFWLRQKYILKKTIFFRGRALSSGSTLVKKDN